jgi:hypothetical protein
MQRNSTASLHYKGSGLVAARITYSTQNLILIHRYNLCPTAAYMGKTTTSAEPGKIKIKEKGKTYGWVLHCSLL